MTEITALRTLHPEGTMKCALCGHGARHFELEDNAGNRKRLCSDCAVKVMTENVHMVRRKGRIVSPRMRWPKSMPKTMAS